MWPFISILILVVLLALLVFALLFKRNASPDRLYMVYYEDGLWELYLGAILLLLAIAEWIDASWIAIIPAILYPVLVTAKQFITAPRLLPADLPPAQGTRRRTIVFTLLGLAFLLGLVVFVLGTSDLPPWLTSWLDRYLLTTIWLLVIALLAGWGYRSGERRLLGYAALFSAALLISFWFDLPLYIYALILGMIICASGFIVTTRFVHDHPKLAQG